jgi:hypothetical protein
MSAGSGSFAVAKDTPFPRQGTVPVGAGKARIQGDLLDPAPEPVLQIGVEIMVSFFHMLCLKDIGVSGFCVTEKYDEIVKKLFLLAS